MDFIFMLTHNDCTVEAPLKVLERVKPFGLRHIGFKDIGASRSEMAALAAGIRASGATSYMEVVSTDAENCLRSARLARDLEIDCLLGGTQVDEILSILRGSRTRYFPFPGRPFGCPTRLGGTPIEVEAQCRSFVEKGCAGADVLAYRATDADPLDLVAAARRGLGEKGFLIVAGSVTTPEQIRLLRSAGANAFTIGSAVFDLTFKPGADSIGEQLAAILSVCRGGAIESA